MLIGGQRCKPIPPHKSRNGGHPDSRRRRRQVTMLESWYGNEGVTSTAVLLDSDNCLARPGASRQSPVGRVNSQMPLRSGRLEKRIEVAIPLQISTILDPDAAERTATENVCSLGIRILTDHARELNERLIISSLKGDLRRLVRVVYCQRLPEGHFAVGLQFQGSAVKWSGESTSPGSLLAAALASFFPGFAIWELAAACG
jgi:hypothetical protein